MQTGDQRTDTWSGPEHELFKLQTEATNLIISIDFLFSFRDNDQINFFFAKYVQFA